LQSLRASSVMRPAWVNEPATFAMELAGEQPSPRPAVRDGMKQELYESRCSHRGSKSKGVGRDFRGCTGRCSNPSASASLASQNDDEFSDRERSELAPQFLFAEFFVWKRRGANG